MTAHRAEVAIVGSGFAGTLCARELLRAGREVLVIERGALRPEADDLPHHLREAELSTTARKARMAALVRQAAAPGLIARGHSERR